MKTNSAATLTVVSIDLSIGLLQISLIFIGFISFVKNYEVPLKIGCMKKKLIKTVFTRQTLNSCATTLRDRFF